MSIPTSVNTANPQLENSPTAARRLSTRLATMVEILLIYAGILLYIWRWQFTFSRVWIVLLAVIVATHFIHKDTPRQLGLGYSNLRSNARAVMPLFLALTALLIVFALMRLSRPLVLSWQETLMMFSNYALWCAFQQYLAQSYFHHRLMSLIRNRHFSSMVAALLFGAAHIPNPTLIVVTTLGGFVLAELFARHRNIWPLALTQAVGGYLVATVFTVALTHNMRVGPGYFFFEIH